MQQVIFFDGLCNLCNGAVQFVIKHDKKSLFKFAALQSEYAKSKLMPYTLQTKQGDSILLLQNAELYEQSTAALKIAKQLNGLWPMLYVFIIVPPFIRNSIYKFIARNRYKWFGKQENCWLPTANLEKRFFN